MKIAIAQINSHLGNFAGNAKKILSFAKEAEKQSCDVVLFPELSLFGYWPGDLLERPSIVLQQNKELEKLQKVLPPDIAVVFGCVTEAKSNEPKFYKNTAVLIYQGKIRKFYKELLPNYDVFDESRHFSRGDLDQNIVKIKGKKLLLCICEDIWFWGEAWEGTRYNENPLKNLKKERVDLILNLSASPYSIGKRARRKSVVEKTAKYLKAPMYYVNSVGAQDELIFDGGSLAVNSKGDCVWEGSYFKEDFHIIDTDSQKGVAYEVSSKEDDMKFLREALSLGIRDFCNKNKIEKLHLGLSGGIDSAVVACLAVDALGAEAVEAIALPSKFNAEESLSLAQNLAKNLNIKLHTIEIQSAYEQELKSFESVLGRKEFSLVNENLQARIRGNYLMAFSNRYGSMLLATGNKCEYATGYSTLYGDMCGGLAPIGDLLKNQVFALARHYNAKEEVIPKRIIERPPSAELRPNQKDEDSLPPYDQLDAAVHKLIVERKAPKTSLEKRVLSMIYANEFKRWQAPPILRVSQHAFGTGRRFPITHQAIF